MEQGVPGTQNEPFFELLHPNALRAPPPLPPSVDASADAASPPHEHSIPPSYDFHLTPSSNSSDASKISDGSTKSEDSRPLASGANHSVSQGPTTNLVRGLDHHKPMEANDACDGVTMVAIDHMMKNYADNLLRVLENVSERLSQLEATVQGLEHSVAGLKSTELEKYDRLTKLELLVQEVLRGMPFLQDKQKLDDTKSQLTKMQLVEQKTTTGGVGGQMAVDGWQQPRVASEEGPRVAYVEPSSQISTPLYPPQGHSQYPHAPSSHAPPPSQMQGFATSQMPFVNAPSNPTSQQPPYPPALQHLPPPQPQQASPPPPPQYSMQMPSFHSQPPLPPPSQSSYSVPMETTVYSHQHHHPTLPTPMTGTYLPEPPQYTSGTHAGPRQQQLSQEVIHPSSQHMYESVVGRLPAASSMPPSYVQPPPKPAPPVSMYEPPSGGGYGASPYRAAQPVPSAPSGATSYPRLPTAQPLHHALPAVSGGTPSTAHSPLDVIQKVVTMGFSREQARAVVRQLTEDGQPVDLNVVLDRLMNGGESTQGPRGWFGRN